MAPAARNVMIVGGGVAGLSAAISLGQRGIKATVVDKAQGAVGASIILSGRVIHALRDLGVLDEILARGTHVAIDEESFWTRVYKPNRERIPIPPPKLPDDWGDLPTALFIYRPELFDILVARAREVGAELHYGTTFESIEPHEDRVDVRLSNGISGSYDLLIGADGIRSTIRERFFPEAGSPIYTGAMAFRMMFENVPDDWLGGFHPSPGGIAVTEMLQDNFFYIAVPNRMEQRWIDQDEAREIVKAAFATHEGSKMFAEAAERLTEDVPVIVGAYEWILVPQPWHRGRILLIGDAVHATTPSLGSAGGMAIEDGVVIAEELAKPVPLEAALEAFNERRWERAKLVVETSVEILVGQQTDKLSGDQASRMRAAALELLSEPY